MVVHFVRHHWAICGRPFGLLSLCSLWCRRLALHKYSVSVCATVSRLHGYDLRRRRAGANGIVRVFSLGSAAGSSVTRAPQTYLVHGELSVSAVYAIFGIGDPDTHLLLPHA